jgi:hypothetical protein
MAHDNTTTRIGQTLPWVWLVQACLGVSVLKARQGRPSVLVQDLRTTSKKA